MDRTENTVPVAVYGPLPSNGRCRVACFPVVAYQRVYMSQYVSYFKQFQETSKYLKEINVAGESSLKRLQSLMLLRNSSRFMEHEGPLPSSEIPLLEFILIHLNPARTLASYSFYLPFYEQVEQVVVFPSVAYLTTLSVPRHYIA
jgi:hypothetical protein